MAEAVASTPAVLPDVPAVEDKLNFGPYARTLLDIIQNPDTQTPLTIGIFGSWGSGKTSLMKMIEAGLGLAARDGQNARQTFAIWFNAWLYSKEETLWRALVMQVLGGLRRIRDLDSTAMTELNDLAEQLYRAVGPSELGTLSIAAAELLSEEGTSAAQITLALQHGLDFLENIAIARQQGELAAARTLRDQVRRATAVLEQERIESLEKFQTQFRALIEKHVLPRGYLVIFVDDLDRCLPDKAVEVLEAIKLFLDVPGCIFILGIDRDVIERGIRLRYGEMGGLTHQSALPLLLSDDILDEGAAGAARYRAFMQGLIEEGKDIIDGGRYLQKIVQIPFVLPPISPDAMGSFVAQLTPNLPDPRCGLVFVRGLEPNPRQVKRSLNIFALLWGLSRHQSYLAERISPVRLAKLVVLQQRHSDLYERLRKDPSLIIAWEQSFRVRRDRPGFLSWARSSGPWTEAEMVTLESQVEGAQTLPDELRLYEDVAALELLLTMHPLGGEGSEGANFVDMTPREVHELIFLARTAEGGERPEPERPVRVEQQVLEKSVHEIVMEPSEPVRLQEALHLSGQEAGFMAKRALGEVARLAEVLGKGGEADEAMIERLAYTGLELAKGLSGGYGSTDVLAALRHETRTLQAQLAGPEGQVMARLPWELIYDGDKDPSMEKVTLEDFWGGRHIIERGLSLAPSRMRVLPSPPAFLSTGRAPRVDLVLDWGVDASPVQDLFSQLEDSWPVQVMLADEPETFRRSLLEDPADIYVIYGRGWQELGEGVIGLGKGYPLTAKEMREWVTLTRKGSVMEKIARRVDRSALFYFCLQGDPSQEVDWFAWFVTLQQFGAAGTIAPLIYTPGKWPLRLMRYFFDLFLGGQQVGEALRSARLRLFEETGNPLGLLYAHFGQSELQLSLPDSEADKESDLESDADG